ncbi:MAG TPA: MYG1 family protein [Dehalococcoidales bacterium]|nr:MYG1 family protein [Dehalococcoidales bacterium]
MNPQLIVTHPGTAHFDEITAISLVLAVYASADFQIVRREPSAAELEDPAIWVIDTGNRLEPAKRNFDHHHSVDCPAAFVLVADYLGLTETLSIFPWWGFKDFSDRIGPIQASAKFGAGDDLVNRNPVEDWLTDYFAQDPQAALPTLRSFGQNIIDKARVLRDQVEYWKTARRLNIAGVSVMLGTTRETFGLEEFRRLEANPPDIVISLDRRSEGWRLFRYEGTQVDFSRLTDCPEIEFAHKNGFLAKTRERLPVEDLVKLIARAVIQP